MVAETLTINGFNSSWIIPDLKVSTFRKVLNLDFPQSEYGCEEAGSDGFYREFPQVKLQKK